MWAPRYSVYVLYWYKSTNTDMLPRLEDADMLALFLSLQHMHEQHARTDAAATEQEAQHSMQPAAHALITRLERAGVKLCPPSTRLPPHASLAEAPDAGSRLIKHETNSDSDDDAEEEESVELDWMGLVGHLCQGAVWLIRCADVC